MDGTTNWPDRVRAAAARRQLPIAELCRQADVPYSTLAPWLRGQTDIGASRFLRLCSVLELDPASGGRSDEQTEGAKP